MPRSQSLLTLIAFCCLHLTGTAEPAAAGLEFSRLDLADGRKLKQVVVKSFDATSGKLLIVANGKAMTIPIEQVPKPFQDALKANARPAGESTSSVPRASAPRSPQGRIVAQATPVPNTPLNPSPAAAPAIGSAEIKQAALDRAQNYYRYEYPAGSGAIRVTAINFETDDPEAIAGWVGRYRVQGRVLLEYFDSRGYSFSRTTDRFDVILEQKPGQSLQVIDFTRK